MHPPGITCQLFTLVTRWYADHMAHREPAPGDLALVQEFVNSVDLESGDDELSTPAAAEEWLAAHGHPGEVDEAGRSRLVEVREGIRALLLANNGEELPPETASRLTELLGSAPLKLSVECADGVCLVCEGSGADRFIAWLTKALLTAKLDGTWTRFKACRWDTCRFAFYDHSKNAVSTWCSPTVCGARAKSRAYRARKRVAAGA